MILSFYSFDGNVVLVLILFFQFSSFTSTSKERKLKKKKNDRNLAATQPEPDMVLTAVVLSVATLGSHVSSVHNHVCISDSQAAAHTLALGTAVPCSCTANVITCQDL